ncbi:hypothetical protein [Spirochaeta dissipatitropha]
MSKAVYNYNKRRVENKLVTAIRKHKREATVADLIAATALPRLQIEEMLPQVVNDYRGHLRVTESGEILYYFPHGVHHRDRSARARFRKFLYRTRDIAVKIGKLLFKIWIMVMLVGYFLIFIALVLAAIAASIAAQSKSNNSSRRSSRAGGGFLMSRLIQQMFYIWMFSGRSRYRYGYHGGRHMGGMRNQAAVDVWNVKRGENDGPPLHHSIFAFVFGDDDPTKDRENQEKQAFIQLVLSRRGVVSLEELRALTGRNNDDAQDLMNRMLLEYEGEPDVSDAGTLIYRFPELLRTASSSRVKENIQPERLLTDMEKIPFNSNSPSLNKWIGGLNAVNLGFGMYFTVFSLMGVLPEEGFGLFYSFVVLLLSDIAANPFTIVLIGLGFVPLLFSLLFYLVPLLRLRSNKKKNEEVLLRNAGRRVWNGLLDTLPVGDGSVNHAHFLRGGDSDRYIPEVLDKIAAEQHADINQDSDNATQTSGTSYSYVFPELRRQILDLQQLRAGIDPQKFAAGKVIFDSNE